MIQNYDKKEIRKTIQQFKPDNKLFEIRLLHTGNKKTASGYFTDADKLIFALSKFNTSNYQFYFTLNSIKPECYSREQHDCFLENRQTTTGNDVTVYNWLFIDLDPVRAAGISSSNEELQLAYNLAKKVARYMHELGFYEPVKAVSGNGAHLLYRIGLANTDENKALIKQCLAVLANLFNTDKVKIDQANIDANRICKLYGTLASKGANTPERPHRMSRLIGDVKEIAKNDKAFLEKLASQLPQAEPVKPNRYNNYNPSQFDLTDFMAKYGLTGKSSSGIDCTIYSLDECPFDASHRNGDSKIFHYSNGAIAFKCHHNSCSGYKWQDVRLKYEPDAYERNSADDRIENGWKQHNRDKQNAIPQIQFDLPMFRNAQDIYADEEPEHEYVKTGIAVIDSKLHGLEKTAVSVISGLRASGKSTVLGQVMLNAVNDGNNVICYSGELNNKKYLSWLIRQCAGKTNIEKSKQYDNYYVVKKEIIPKILSWFGNHFWLYDNRHGNNFMQIANCLRQEIVSKKADLCVIDNLMALDLSNFGSDKYDAQTKFVWELKSIAQETNCHIIFVAHPKKASGFLRLDDISGTGNIGNIVDNAFIVHRNNNDFKRLSAEMFKWKTDNPVYQGTNVIEIAKDRENGLQDEFITLFYDEPTKRMLNNQVENVVYSWDSEQKDDFIQADELEIPF